MTRVNALLLVPFFLAGAMRSWSQTSPTCTTDCPQISLVRYVPPETTLSGVFYFPWHGGSGECPAPGVWCGCFSQAKPGNPRPLLGFYDSSNATVVNAHMQQIADHGVQVVGVEWFGFGAESGIAGFNGSNFENVVVPAIASRGLKFALVYDTAIRLTESGTGLVDFDVEVTRQRFINDFAQFASRPQYYSHPNYLKFGNKPVVYIYVTRAVEATNLNHIRDTFQQAHDAARAAGFDGLYIVADHLYWNDENKAKYFWLRQLMGASAATAFAPVEHDRIPTTGRPVVEWAKKISTDLYDDALRRLADISDVDIMPGIFPQYDDNGFGPPGPDQPCAQGRQVLRHHLVDGTDWSEMIRRLGLGHRWIAEKITQRSDCTEEITTKAGRTSIVWTYSFNEWGEGAGIEPLETRTPKFPYGFGSELLERLDSGLKATGTGFAPVAPILRNPIGGLEGARPLFTWDGAQFATEYELMVRNPSGVTVIGTSVTSTSYRPAQPLAIGAYTWQVRARNNVGWGEFSEEQPFTVGLLSPAPEAPVLDQVSYCGTQDLVLSWIAAAGATEYSMALNEQASGNSVLDVVIPGTSYAVELLNPEHLYELKVKAMNQCGESIAMLALVGNCAAGCSSITPTFSAGPSDVLLGETVTFQADMSRLATGSTPLWNAGDSHLGQGATWSHVFEAAGSYPVVMMAQEVACLTTQLSELKYINVVDPDNYLNCQPGQTADCCGNGSCEAGESDLRCPLDCGCLPESCPTGVSGAWVNNCGALVDCGPPLDCGAMGGDLCSQTSSCPGGYSSLGQSSDCATCCDLACVSSGCPTGACGSQVDNCGNTINCEACTPVCGDGDCAAGIEDCGTCLADCPCWQAGTVCSASGAPGQCVEAPCVSNGCPSGSCGSQVDNCGQAIECGDCGPVCGDGACAPGVEDCGTCLQDCPCWQSGTTCNAAGSPGQCVLDCADPSSHPHSGECGATDECGHSFGADTDCGCPGDNHVHDGSCGAADACGHTFGADGDCDCPGDTHSHAGSCGSTDSCGHSFGASTDCGCADAPIVYDTCYEEVCDTGWSWVDEYCESCNEICDTCSSCWDECDESGCWTNCSDYPCNCRTECSSYVCGGHWESYQYNCRNEPYPCNPRQCGF